MAVVKAVEKVYAAKAEQARATKGKKDSGFLATALADARTEELQTVAALDRHKKEHGCVEAAAVSAKR